MGNGNQVWSRTYLGEAKPRVVEVEVIMPAFARAAAQLDLMGVGVAVEVVRMAVFEGAERADQAPRRGAELLPTVLDQGLLVGRAREVLDRSPVLSGRLVQGLAELLGAGIGVGWESP